MSNTAMKSARGLGEENPEEQSHCWRYSDRSLTSSWAVTHISELTHPKKQEGGFPTCLSVQEQAETGISQSLQCVQELSVINAAAARSWAGFWWVTYVPHLFPA